MGYVSFCVCESNILKGNGEELFVKPPESQKQSTPKEKNISQGKGPGKQRVKQPNEED
jgi:hypothetical protein